MKLRKFIALSSIAGASLLLPTAAQAAETVKVGVLHSLSGTMAISETSLRDVLLFTFDEVNKAGGVMGKMIEPVVVDGASDWPLFAEKAKQLLEQDKCAVVLVAGHPSAASRCSPSSRRITACSFTLSNTREKRRARMSFIRLRQ
jgi:ABC-type branched-subunit amino acid transport system substrate-binding protein